MCRCIGSYSACETSIYYNHLIFILSSLEYTLAAIGYEGPPSSPTLCLWKAPVFRKGPSCRVSRISASLARTSEPGTHEKPLGSLAFARTWISAGRLGPPTSGSPRVVLQVVLPEGTLASPLTLTATREEVPAPMSVAETWQTGMWVFSKVGVSGQWEGLG